MARAFVVGLTLALSTAAIAAEAPKPAAPTVVSKEEKLMKAGGLSQVIVEANRLDLQLGKAKLIGVIVEGPGGQKDRATIVVQPSDPEWQTVNDAVKALATRKKEAAQKELDALKINVAP